MTDTPVNQEARTIGDEIREMGAEAAQAAKDATQAAKDTVRSYADRAREEAYARGESYRDIAAEETSKLASVLRRASQDLNSGSPQERLVGQIADGVANAAERMRGTTFDDIARDITEFAKHYPAAFLGGAAFVGFAVARFMKASTRDEFNYLPASSRPRRDASSDARGDDWDKSAASEAPAQDFRKPDPFGPSASSSSAANVSRQGLDKSSVGADGQGWNKSTPGAPEATPSKPSSTALDQSGSEASATDPSGQRGNKSTASKSPGQS